MTSNDYPAGLGPTRLWHQLTPAEQQAAWDHHNAVTQRWTPAPVQAKARSTIATVSLALGLAGLLIFPALFGPASLVTGIVGWAKAREGHGSLGAAIAGTLLGVFSTLYWLVTIGGI